jgi:hypothetical protein
MTIIDTNRITELLNIINSTRRRDRNDPLKEFALVPIVEELEMLRTKSLSSLFKVCKKFGVRYIKLDPSEICGCENIRYDRWPAIWQIARETSISGGCGNNDQAHTKYGRWFLDVDYGYWDIQENRKLCTEEYTAMNFREVYSK